MRFLVAALAALLLAVPAAAEAQSTISMPGVGAALTVSTGANGGGVRVTGGGYYNGQDYFSITRAPNFPADAIGDFTKGKPCESGGTGVVNCIAPPASVTFTGGTGADTVYIGSTPGGGVNVTSILTGGGNDTVRVGGNGSRGPIDGGEGVDMIAPHFTYLASGGGWTIDLAAGTVTSNGAPGTSYSATNFEWVDLDTSLGAPGGTHTVYGTDGPNTIYGGRSGLQTISGRGGDDRLVAGVFDKAVIDGGAGNDTISGGTLDDVLTGGSGADKFNCGAGVDLVTDFNSAEGDTITADCEQVLPAEFDITRVGRGEYTFHSRIVADPAVKPLRLSWEYGNGKTEGDVTIGRTTYDKPGTYSVVHRALDINNTPYRKTKTLEIPAPELAVGVSIDEAALSGGRLPLDTWVNAKVRVASTGDDGVGDLSNLKFTDAVLKAGGTAQVELELPRGAGRVRPAGAGHPPGLRRAREGAHAWRRRLQLDRHRQGRGGQGREQDRLHADPRRPGPRSDRHGRAQGGALEVDNAATPPRPIKQPVTLTLRVRNVSGQPARNLTLNVDPAIREATGYNPAAPFPLTVRGTSTGVPVRDLANGEATDVVFTADAANKAIVDVRAVARGTAIASGSLPVREIAGNGTTDVRIDQPKLIALTADGPDYAGVVKAGGRWTYSGHVENLSPNRAITVFVFAKRSQNGSTASCPRSSSRAAAPAASTRAGAPGGQIPVHASLGSSPDGGSRAMIDIGIVGTVHEPEGDKALTENAIVVAPGAAHREASIDLTEPVNDPFSLTEAGWLMTDSAARAFSARVQSVFDTPAAAMASAQTFIETPKSLYLQRVIAIIREEVPEAVARTRSEIAYTLQEMAGLSAAEALAECPTRRSRPAWSRPARRGTTRPGRRWPRPPARCSARSTPDLVLEAAMPALAACKLLKYGGKSAMLRKAATLGETRAGRLLAKGLEGLVPGDEISRCSPASCGASTASSTRS